MPMSSRLIERAIELWKTGQKIQAHKIFEAIIYNDRRNEAAWVWYIHTMETDQERIAGLENFLIVFPEHATARQALARLRKEVEQRPPEPKRLVVSPPVERDRIVPGKPVQTQGAHSPRQTRSSLVPWVIMMVGLCLFALSLVRFNASYNALQRKTETLAAQNQSLSQALDRLQKDHTLLLSNHQRLTEEYNSLAQKYNSLQEEHSILVNSHNSLNNEYNQLMEKYNTLAGEYNTLNNIAIQPPYIVVHDRMVDTTFYDTDGALITWTTPFSGLEHGIEYGSYMRGLIVDDEWKTTLVRTEDGTPLWIRDFSVFVTPETFQNVVPELYEKSPSAYEFIYRIWYIIGQLSNYAVEDTETPRYSLETLLAGGGDCEDLSILFASLIEAAPVDWYVDLVYIDSDHPTHPVEPDHVVVYIDTGYETYIVETTSDQSMLPYTDGVSGWLASSLQSGEEELYPVYLR